MIFLLTPIPAPAKEKTPDLRIFFSSDTRGMLRRCGCSDGQLGGLSARAAYIKKHSIRDRTIVLDAGDALHDGPTPPEGMESFFAVKSGAVLSAMEQAGYDAGAVGDYDLVFGTGVLKNGRKDMFPLLSANLEVYGRRPFNAYILKETAKTKVAIVGVLDDQFPYASFGSYEGVKVYDPAKAAREALAELKRADLRIVLAHLSVTDPVEYAKSVPEADIVIQGHSADILDSPIKAGKALVVKGFFKGKQIGMLDLWLKGKKTSGRIVDYKYRVVALDESIPADKEVEKTLASYREYLKRSAQPYPYLQGAAADYYAGPAECRGCHAEAYTNWSATRHASAWATLPKTSDEYDPECLPCHTTGYRYIAPGPGKKPAHEGMKNVTCEACHGPGAAHVRAAKEGSPAASLISREVDEDACRKCHDDYQSPHFEYEGYKEMGGAHRRRERE